MPAVKCGECAFFRLVDDVADFGLCHRHPPTVALVPVHDRLTQQQGMRAVSYRPEVSGSDKCGDGERLQAMFEVD